MQEQKTAENKDDVHVPERPERPIDLGGYINERLQESHNAAVTKIIGLMGGELGARDFTQKQIQERSSQQEHAMA